MKIQLEPSPTYFVHIPKTGGSGFGMWLRMAYPPHSCLELGRKQLGQLTVGALGGHKYYHDWHHGLGMFSLLGNDNLSCLTLLRDPVERVVSAIEQRKRIVLQKPSRFTESYCACVLSLIHAEVGECLGEDVFAEIVNNHQTHILGARKDFTPMFKGSVDAATGRTVQIPYSLPNITDISDMKRVLENAQHWLSKMAVVGLTERYAESVMLTCDLLGIAPSPVPPWANVNPQRSSTTMRYRDQLDAAVLTRLEELNSYDLELYAFAQDRFVQQWSAYQARPRRTYSIAPRVRQTVEPLRQSLRPVKRLAKKIIRSLQP